RPPPNAPPGAPGAPQSAGWRGGTPAVPPPPPPGTPPDPNADPTHMKMDLAPIRRELFREMAPNGTFETMTPDERQRVGREVNQRLLGIVQGFQITAAELQKKAEAAKLLAAAERAGAAPPAAPA